MYDKINLTIELDKHSLNETLLSEARDVIEYGQFDDVEDLVAQASRATVAKMLGITELELGNISHMKLVIELIDSVTTYADSVLSVKSKLTVELDA